MEKRELIQRQAVQHMIAQNYTGAYVIAPRVGKSKIVIEALDDKFHNWDITIATPRADINKSWYKELALWNSEAPTPDVICFPSIKKMKKKPDLMVIDEWHMLSPNQMDAIKAVDPTSLLLVTGTANDYSRGLLRYKLGMEVGFEYPIEQAILDGVIANFEVWVVKVPLENKWKKYRLKGIEVTERQLYDYYTIVFDELRVKARANRNLEKTKEIVARRRAQLVYTMESKKEVAKYIVSEIRERLLVFTTRTAIADELVPRTYHSKNKKEGNLGKFINGEIDSLGVVKMTDMGITFPNLKVELVHQLQSNSEDSLQKFLRVCNLEDEKIARIIITVCKDTMDEAWAMGALAGVPEEKVKWIEMNELENLLNKFR